MTNGDGQVVMDQDYIPFGGDLPGVDQIEAQNDLEITYKYTGQSEVVSIGLYYYKARYYDQSIGRFITEDTWPGELNNPQSQNLYVYVMNNSMKYIDPTGNVPTTVIRLVQRIRMIDFRKTYQRKLKRATQISQEHTKAIRGLSDEPVKETVMFEDLSISNTDIEAGYSYKKDITAGVMYFPGGTYRIRNVVSVEVNINPEAELQLKDGGISVKLDNTKIDVNESGLSIEHATDYGLGISSDFTSTKMSFTEELSSNDYGVNTAKSRFFPSTVNEYDPVTQYIPMYVQEISAKDTGGYVNITQKHIFEVRPEDTALAGAAVGKVAAIGFEKGKIIFGELLRRIIPEIPELPPLREGMSKLG